MSSASWYYDRRVGFYRCASCGLEDETVEMRESRRRKLTRPLCNVCALGRGKLPVKALVRLQHDRETTDRDLHKLYGITIEDYERLVLAQRGRCAICRKHPGSDRRLAVDHSHRFGHVRGLLCHKCNTAVGLLGDNSAVAERLAAYLDEPPAVRALGVTNHQPKAKAKARPLV